MTRRLQTWTFDHNGVTRSLDNPSYPNVGKLVFFLDTRTKLDELVTAERFPNLELLHVDARTHFPSLLRLVASHALRGLRITGIGFEDFAGFMAKVRAEQMRSFALSGVGVSGEKVEALRELAHFVELEHLELQEASLGAKGGAILGALGLPKLRRLALDYAALGATGLRGVARIAGLRQLMLGGNRLESDDLAVLGRSPSCQTLEWLSLNDNRGLDDRALEHLRALPALTRIEVERTNITREAASAFEASNGVSVIGTQSLRSGKVMVVGPGKSDTPEALEDAIEEFQPGAILTMLTKGELAWDGEYDPFASDDWTRAFHIIAGIGGTKEVTKAVKDHGRSVDERDLQGRSPLFFACIGPDLRPWDGERNRRGSEPTVKRLLELGADVHVADAAGRMALHNATHVGAEKCVRRLLRAGAKNVPDREGVRPSDLARMFEHPALVALLEKVK